MRCIPAAQSMMKRDDGSATRDALHATSVAGYILLKIPSPGAARAASVSNDHLALALIFGQLRRLFRGEQPQIRIVERDLQKVLIVVRQQLIDQKLPGLHSSPVC